MPQNPKGSRISCRQNSLTITGFISRHKVMRRLNTGSACWNCDQVRGSPLVCQTKYGSWEIGIVVAVSTVAAKLRAKLCELLLQRNIRGRHKSVSVNLIAIPTVSIVGRSGYCCKYRNGIYEKKNKNLISSTFIIHSFNHSHLLSKEIGLSTFPLVISPMEKLLTSPE